MKKMNRLLKVTLAIAMVILTVGVCFSSILPAGLEDFFFGGQTLGILAMAVGAGVEGAGESTIGGISHESIEGLDTDIHEIDLEKTLVKVMPTSSPIDQIVREMGANRKALGIETGGWERGTRPILDKVTADAAASATSAIEIVVGNISMWTKQSTLLVHAVNGGSGTNIKPLVLYVYDTDPITNKLKCVAINPTATGGALVPAITEDTVIQRLGTANNEKDAQAIAFSVTPTNRTNYCQIFMGQVEVGVLEEMQKKKINIGFAEYKQQELWDFRRQIESAYLFGHKGMTNDPIKSKLIYTCDGAWNQVQKEFIAPTTITDDDFIDMTETVFDGQNGSDRKILFAGKTLLSDMMKSATYQKQLEANRTEMVFGLKFNLIETNYGELLVRRHELFVGNMVNQGIVLDPSFMVKERLEALHVKDLDLDGSGQSRVNAQRILETSCLYLENLPTHCKITRA